MSVDESTRCQHPADDFIRANAMANVLRETGYSHMIGTVIPVVSLRGANHGFWSQLGCSATTFFSCQVNQDQESFKGVNKVQSKLRSPLGFQPKFFTDIVDSFITECLPRGKCNAKLFN